VGYGYRLNSPGSLLAVYQSKRELSEQELARPIRSGHPTLMSLEDLGKSTLNLSVELESSVWAALKVSVERGIKFGSGFFVKIDHPIEH
jgi:hypothetical protein